jgi:hypothetical protein
MTSFTNSLHYRTTPNEYADLVHFIVDTEGYKKKLQQKGEVQVKKGKVELS